jgi:hypothetical protein
MSKRFATADAFRQAIEVRLRTEADRRELSVNDLRLRFVMERLLARLFAAEHPPWLLKGRVRNGSSLPTQCPHHARH